MFKKNGISHLYFAFVFNESKTQYFLEKFEDTKRVIRRKTDNTKKKDNRQTMTKHDVQNTTQKTNEQT